MDWADLITVDLALYDTPGGKKQLAEILIKAVREDGFFYVKNFNISQERVNRQFSIGKQFYDLPLEEKAKYTVEGLGTSSLNLAGCQRSRSVTGLQTRASSMDMFLLVATCKSNYLVKCNFVSVF